MAGEGTLDFWNIKIPLSLLPLEHQEVQVNLKSTKGSFSEDQKLSIVISSEKKNSLLCYSTEIWELDAFQRKTVLFLSFQSENQNERFFFYVFLTQLKHFSWPIWKHFFLGQFSINFSLPRLPHCPRDTTAHVLLSFFFYLLPPSVFSDQISSANMPWDIVPSWKTAMCHRD